MISSTITTEQALQEAIGYEKRIRDLYREAADRAEDPVAKKVYGALGDDEQGHVTYLEHQLKQVRTSGVLTVGEVPTAIPERAAFKRLTAKVETELEREDRKDEKQMLSKALQVEVETSAFYRRMAEQTTGPLSEMFERFLEIEDGHIAAVEAELEYLKHSGFWFDFKEFDMEH